MSPTACRARDGRIGDAGDRSWPDQAADGLLRRTIAHQTALLSAAIGAYSLPPGDLSLGRMEDDSRLVRRL